MENQKQKKRRLKHSNLMLTVNTNDFISENPDDPIRQEKINRLRTAIKNVFNEDFLKYYISLRADDPRLPEGSAIDSNWIHPDKIMIQYSLERGSKTGFLHSHIGIFISHYTIIKYELEKLKEDVKKAVAEQGWESPFIHHTYSQSANPDQTLQDYVSKSPIS